MYYFRIEKKSFFSLYKHTRREQCHIPVEVLLKLGPTEELRISQVRSGVSERLSRRQGVRAGERLLHWKTSGGWLDRVRRSRTAQAPTGPSSGETAHRAAEATNAARLYSACRWKGVCRRWYNLYFLYIGMWACWGWERWASVESRSQLRALCSSQARGDLGFEHNDAVRMGRSQRQMGWETGNRPKKEQSQFSTPTPKKKLLYGLELEQLSGWRFHLLRWRLRKNKFWKESKSLVLEKLSLKSS